jgi:UDP-glucose-4-epimerase GalE
VSAGESILVTGGVGFVGSHFARAAHEAGRRVVIVDDHSGGPPVALPPAIPVIVADIGDREIVARVCRDHQVGAVAHFAGKIQVGESVMDPSKYFDVNLVRTLALLETIRHAGIESFIFSSTAAVYGNPASVPIEETARREPVNPYGATKLGIEYALAAWEGAYGLRWAALRYFNAAGAHPDGTMRENHTPETHLLPLAIDAALGKAAPLTVFGADYPTADGTCVRDYIHVVDLADAHLAALARLEAGAQLGAANLGTGTGYSVKEVLAAVARVSGREVPHSVGARRAGDPPALVADPGRAGQLLDWRARRSGLDVLVEDAVRARTP